MQTRFILHEDSLTEKINVAVKRGQDFQLIAGLVYCCDGYPTPVQPSSKNLENWLNVDESPSTQFKETIRDVLTAFWHIANRHELNYAFRNVQKRVAPAEFIFTGACAEFAARV